MTISIPFSLFCIVIGTKPDGRTRETRIVKEALLSGNFSPVDYPELWII